MVGKDTYTNQVIERSKRLRPYVVRDISIPHKKNDASIVVFPWEPQHHSQKAPYVGRLLTSPFLYDKLGEMIRHPSVIRELNPEDDPDVRERLTRGRIYKYTVHGFLDILPKMQWLHSDHEFWQWFSNTLTICLFFPHEDQPTGRCSRFRTDGEVSAYFVNHKNEHTFHLPAPSERTQIA